MGGRKAVCQIIRDQMGTRLYVQHAAGQLVVAPIPTTHVATDRCH